MKKKITFEENGGEYWGDLIIDCQSFENTNKNTIIVNGAKIEIDENIIKIQDI